MAMAVKKKLTYFGHVMRNSNGMGRDIMLGKTEGGRRRGRQRTRWIEEVTNSTGRTLDDLKEMVLNRNAWKGVVHDVTRVARDLMDAERGRDMYHNRRSQSFTITDSL